MSGNSNHGLHDQLIFELLKAIDRLNEKIDSTKLDSSPIRGCDSITWQTDCKVVLEKIRKLEDGYAQLLDVVNNLWDELSAVNTRLAIIERSMKAIYSEVSMFSA
ncbi:MAG: hypothetical protein GSR82_04395 [Desulfurococcales archaeon]|nr:hypothetical protein [Desulfurococcales archaeon]MEB3799220.1 hypothetical protein [Desulfurococcales archaeon]